MNAAAGLPEGLRFIQRDWLSCNQLLMFDDGGATLIDSGYVKHAALTHALVARALERSPVPGAPPVLARLINTHLHSDHCGGNATLARAYRCEVLVPTGCLAAVQAWDQAALTFEGTGQRCERFVATGALAPGERFVGGGIEWEVAHAPGHDPTSLIFFAPRHRILVSADALWENGFGVIFPELVDESGFAEQAGILDLIEALEPALVVPGHGALFTDVAGALARARSRLAAMRAQPLRHARSAMKVLVKFLMLELERAPIEDLVRITADATIMHRTAAMMGISLPAALHAAIDALVAQGELAREGSILVSH